MVARIETGEGRDSGADEGRRSSRQRIVVGIILFAAGILNWYAGRSGWPYLRFDSAQLRAYAGLVILAIPWLVFLQAATSRPFKRKWVRIVLLAVLALIILLTIPVALMELPFWTPDQPLASVKMGGYRVRLYQLDCGAICDFAVGVDQERVLVPPLMISRHLYVFDGEVNATLEVIGKNKVRVSTLPYTDNDPNVRVQVFQMKPHFFF